MIPPSGRRSDDGYFRELDSKPDVWEPIIAAARLGSVTLVYTSKDERHNNAVALKDYIEARLGKRSAEP